MTRLDRLRDLQRILLLQSEITEKISASVNTMLREELLKQKRQSERTTKAVVSKE